VPGLVINVEDLSEEPAPFRLPLEGEAWDRCRDALPEHELAVRETLALQLDGHSLGRRLLFRGRLAGSVELPCARCAETYEQRFDEPVELLLEPFMDDGEVPEGGVEIDAEDGSLGRYAGEELDFEPLVTEVLLLAWPMQPRCTEDCRGLCPGCGQNLNDARSEGCACEGNRTLKPFADLAERLREAKQTRSKSDDS
jgi:uncharacterized protein